jgi:hypothetical protein
MLAAGLKKKRAEGDDRKKELLGSQKMRTGTGRRAGA